MPGDDERRSGGVLCTVRRPEGGQGTVETSAQYHENRPRNDGKLTVASKIPGRSALRMAPTSSRIIDCSGDVAISEAINLGAEYARLEGNIMGIDRGYKVLTCRVTESQRRQPAVLTTPDDDDERYRRLLSIACRPGQGEQVCKASARHSK